MGKETYSRQMYRCTYEQMDRQTNEQTDRWADVRTDRQTLIDATVDKN
jgi:hypothetical protein